MLKMFTTQLTGIFKKMVEKEEYSLEDGARLLAQAAAGDGTIYIFGTHEMRAVEIEATEGAEPLRSVKILSKAHLDDLTDADRVLLFSRFSTDEAAAEVAAFLSEKGIPFVAVSSELDKDRLGPLSILADVHIDLALTKGLLPDEQGNRFGFPSSMAALFVYYGLKFTYEEIVAEYDL